MNMLIASVDAQSGKSFSADGIVRDHTLNSKLHSQLRLLSHEGGILHLFQSADITGVTDVVFLLKLFAGEDCLFAVDDDNVISAIYMRCVSRLILAAKKICCKGRDSAERLALSVDNIPLAGNFAPALAM